MSVISVTAYALVCDTCGQRFLGYEGEQLTEKPADIQGVAAAYGWLHSAGRDVCQACRYPTPTHFVLVTDKEGAQ